MKYIAAIDQGTTSTRCIIFDEWGNIISIDQKEHRQIYPQPGWVEHDPVEIWQNTLCVVKNAIQKSQLKSEDIAAIGITNQRETTLVWDRKTGKPYMNALVWQDTRTNEICNTLCRNGGKDRYREKTGLPIATYFSGPKIEWILENHPEIRKAANLGDALFGNIDTWLIWNLTGGSNGGIHVTDVTNASRTMLMNLYTLSWDEEILKDLDIPRQILPEIHSSSEVYGEIKNKNLPNIPICGDLGDQQAALFGQACFSPGDSKNTYGTGCFMLMNTGNDIFTSNYGLITTLGYRIGNNAPIYCLEGSIAITGALIQWLRDNLEMIQKLSDVESLAQSVKDNGGVYFVPAFSGLFAPYWMSSARGIIIGLTRYVKKGHIARAALEATAFQVHEVLDAMEKDSHIILHDLKVDGGMVRNELLMKFQSDILNVPIVRPKILETTALGAAYAAGLAIGYWNNLDQLKKNWQAEKCWRPTMNDDERKKLIHNWKKAVKRTFHWVE